MQQSWEAACKDALTKLTDLADTATPLDASGVPSWRDALVNEFPKHLIYVTCIPTIARQCWKRLNNEGADTNVDRIVTFLSSKQHDYGHMNITSFGQSGIIVRLCDKLSRLENLEGSSAKPRNETILDTLYDILGYCVISRMLAADTFKYDLERKYR